MKKIILIAYVFLGFINIEAQNFPMSDPSNTEGWIFNPDVSDEFNGTTLDKTKWWILGENNDYRNKWKGRAPGQFVAHNVKVENGDLVLTSQWEPSFTFVNETQGNPEVQYGGTGNSQPITQACVMSEKFFKYGYMEIRCKSADAPVTNAFWTTGYHSEIDMTENYGKRPIGNPKNRPENLERRYRTNVITWDPTVTGPRSYKTEHVLAERTASDYFVYGFEWDKNFIKIYYNGILLETKTRAQIENEENVDWVWDFPQELWVDSEVFEWYGLPAAADLVNPAEFKIDYIRIWQKELLSGKDLDPLGFEGPFHYNGRSRNWSGGGSSSNWRMEDEKPLSGDFSLRYKQTSSISSFQTIFAPTGSLDLPSGTNTINLNIWIDPISNINELTFILGNPNRRIDIGLTGVNKGEWVSISQLFSRNASNNNDNLRIQVRNDDVSGNNVLFYLDDISFEKNNAVLSTVEKKVLNFNMYPNPAKENLTIVSKENSTIEIINSLGITVKQVKNASKSQNISVNDLTSGIYFISVNHNNTKAVKKLVIN